MERGNEDIRQIQQHTEEAAAEQSGNVSYQLSTSNRLPSDDGRENEEKK